MYLVGSPVRSDGLRYGTRTVYTRIYNDCRSMDRYGPDKSHWLGYFGDREIGAIWWWRGLIPPFYRRLGGRDGGGGERGYRAETMSSGGRT